MIRGKRDAVCIAIALCLSAFPGRASGSPPDEGHDDKAPSKLRVADVLGPPSWGQNATGPLCGVYAACTSLELIGIKANPHDFIAAKYVGRCGGSSPVELARIIADSGAHAQILSHLSSFDLSLIACPLIANVRMNPASDRFNHWVVAIPGEKGLTVFDGLQKPYDVPVSQFLAIWSGVGICVAPGDANPLAAIWLGRFSLLLLFLQVAIFTVGSRGLLEQMSRMSVFKQLLGIGVASLLFGLAGNAVFGDLAHHWSGVQAATAAGQTARYRTGTLEDAKKASDSHNTLLIDARREEDYQLGSIKGAVNIPVTASAWEISSYLEKLDRKTPIVVFCQSAYCGYDETVATELVSLGFTNVTACNEGWSEFQKSTAGAGRQ